MLSRLKDLYETIGRSFLVKRPVVPSEVFAERYGQCEACPNFLPDKHVCKECGCYMRAKCFLSGAKCPIGKWGIHTGDTVELGQKTADELRRNTPQGGD